MLGDSEPLMSPYFTTEYGELFHSDCLELLRGIPSGSVHMFFADPPFNLGKKYGSAGKDNLPGDQYVSWSREWLAEAARILVDGGALFVYNLPKWLIEYGAFLNSDSSLTFKHWIAINKPHSLPIPNRLSPAHYGMLFYIKGQKPRVFNRDSVRIPIRKCRHCGKDIKDYGGHRKALNPIGLNLGDVWDDIPPVRHKKYKYRAANELSEVIVERAIKLTTVDGDLICDPFMGSGTTAYVSERLHRRWIGGDLNSCETAKQRLNDLIDGVHPVWASETQRFAECACPVRQTPLFG